MNATHSNSKNAKGFTLIELLVVIGIVVVLSVVVLLTLNPAQLLRQARDSTRISDLGTLKSALALYLADVTTPALGNTGLCYVSTSTSPGVNCLVFAAGTTTVTNAASSSLVNGQGWIPVNFNDISSGAPLSVLPLDPTNTAALFYAYRANTSTLVYELDAILESNKYIPLMSTDGGNISTAYEVGTDPGLDL